MKTKSVTMSDTTAIFFLFFMSAVLWTAAASQRETSFYTGTDNELFVSTECAALAYSDLHVRTSGHPGDNPALFPDAAQQQFTFDYAGYYHNQFSTSSLAYIKKLDARQVISMSANYLLIPDIPITAGLDTLDDGTLEIDEGKIVYESASTMLATWAYGYRWFWGTRFELGVGMQLRAKRKNLLGFSQYGSVGYALGALTGLLFRDNALGAGVSVLCDNVPGHYVYWSDRYAQLGRPSMQLAGGWQREIAYMYGHIQLSAATKKFVFGNILEGHSVSENGGIPDVLGHIAETGHYGAEYTIHDIVVLRLGSQPSRFPLTFGAGVQLWARSLSIDFAYRHHGELPGTYQMGMTYAR